MANGDSNGVTKVRFDLWAVLGFLVLLFALCFGYLFNAQAINKEERVRMDQALYDRVTKIETQYGYIVQALEKVSVVADEIRMDQIRRQRRERGRE